MSTKEGRECQPQATPAPSGGDSHTPVTLPRASQTQPESQNYAVQQTQQQPVQEEPTKQQGHNPGPPPFDPMSQHHHTHSHHHGSPAFGSNALGQSVVPDLMKVYESLTQSSTPQHNTVTAHHPTGTTQVQTQELPQQQPLVEQPAVGTAPQQPHPQQVQYQYYQSVPAPTPTPAPAPAQQTAHAPHAAPAAPSNSSLHYYVHPQAEGQQQPTSAPGHVYYQVPQQQQGQYQQTTAPAPQQHQQPQPTHHQYTTYQPQQAHAPPAQVPVTSQQPPPSHPQAIAGSDTHHRVHPSHASTVPVHHAQPVQVQVSQPQVAAVSAQAPVSNQTPAPPPVSSATVQQPPASTRSSRKRSSNGSDEGSTSSRPRSRKKGGSADGRWSKRFQWPDELHREFVSAVFDVGLKHSSPSAILEHMTPNEAITSERIKSHLQKYRLHRQRSKREFMRSYDTAVGKFKSAPGGVLGDADEVRTLSCGEVAAHLSCATISDPSGKLDVAVKSETTPPMPPLPAPNPIDTASTAAPADPNTASASSQARQGAGAEAQAVNQGSFSGGALHLPQLTEEEKRSPIGASMGYLMGLFFSLDQQLQSQRKAGVTGGNAPSSAQGPVPPAVSHGTAGAAPGTGKYVPIIAAPVQGAPASIPQAPVMMPPPQAATVPAPAPGQAVSVAISQAPAPFAPVQTRTQEQGQFGKANPPVSAGSSGQAPIVSHPSFQPPPANARHPTQPHLPLHSHSASIIEENDMMKRDMRSQMAFQNKMRALKEQEQRKYRTATDSSPGSTKNEVKNSKEEGSAVTTENTKPETGPKSPAPDGKASEGANVTVPSQVVGESSNGDGRGADRSQDTKPQPPPTVAGQSHADGKNSIGSAPDGAKAKGSGQDEVAAGATQVEFWNADVVDEQLFEFLMS